MNRDRSDIERRADVDQRVEEEVDVEVSRASIPPISTWKEIKSRFVDDPDGALAAAEDLVRSAVDERVRRLTQEFEELRVKEPAEGASATEELRTRLIRYEAYYDSIRGTTTH